ncbi:MAG: L,D-transpeptidase family protein [Legionella sp.]
MTKIAWNFVFGVLFLLLAYGAFALSRTTFDPCADTYLQKVPAFSSQVIMVHLIEGSKVEGTACEKQGNFWKRALKPFLAVIGKNGIAPHGKKKEGDMKTPAGLFPLGNAFGTKPLALNMDFRYVTSEDKFIDDAAHKNYNTWVTGKTDAKSYEPMLISAYKLGIVVNYNMNPIVPGAGSAIFMHLWQSIKVPTHGCIAMDEYHLSALLHWLDKKQHPYIFIKDQ